MLESLIMKRATIIVTGDVQRVGYRDMVQGMARECAITGFVRNVHPYDVEIIAEGEEQALKTFIDAIRIQKPPVFVEELNVVLCGDTYAGCERC